MFATLIQRDGHYMWTSTTIKIFLGARYMCEDDSDWPKSGEMARNLNMKFCDFPHEISIFRTCLKMGMIGQTAQF